MIGEERVNELIAELNGYMSLLHTSPQKGAERIRHALKNWNEEERAASQIIYRLQSYWESHSEYSNNLGKAYCSVILHEFYQGQESFQLSGTFRLRKGIKIVDVVAGIKLLLKVEILDGNLEEIANFLSIAMDESKSTIIGYLKSNQKTFEAELRIKRKIERLPKFLD